MSFYLCIYISWRPTDGAHISRALAGVTIDTVESIWRLLGYPPPPPRSSPPTVESDDVYPVHLLDSSKLLKSIIITWTLRFNDILDPDKLQNSLSRLLEIGDWRKIGGRLRLKENGQLEVHVPRPFTAERPAVFYTHKKVSIDIEDHPDIQTLPKATSGPSIQPGPAGSRIFGAREDAPEHLDEFIYSDLPQLALHITSFNNATLIALSFPHTLMDAIGQQALLQGWSAVLAGCDADVPAALGARQDDICVAADMAVKEDFNLKSKQLGTLGMISFGARYAWDLLWGPTSEAHHIFMPKKVVSDLQSEAQKDLAAANPGKTPPFVSEGDVLTAWVVRSLATSVVPKPRPVTVAHVINARYRVSSLVKAQGVYIQNLVTSSFAFLSPEVVAGKLGHIALENRKCLMEQSTEGQFLASVRETQRAGVDAQVMYGDSNAVLLPWTNWTKAKIWEAVDFSAAVVRVGETGEARTNPPGSLVCHHSHRLGPIGALLNLMVVLGKDLEGNYWMMGIMSPLTWAKIAEDFEKM